MTARAPRALAGTPGEAGQGRAGQRAQATSDRQPARALRLAGGRLAQAAPALDGALTCPYAVLPLCSGRDPLHRLLPAVRRERLVFTSQHNEHRKGPTHPRETL